jgi:fatty-acyl-CoA synthase
VIVLKANMRDKVDEKSIIEWCHANMAAYKVPRSVEFVETLPKTGSGKIMWRALQEVEDKKLSQQQAQQQ